MHKTWLLYISLFTLVVGSVIPATPFVYALQQPSVDQAAQAELQLQLRSIEEQIARLTAELGGVKGERTTLQKRIAQLKSNQSVLLLQSQAIELRLKDLEAAETKTVRTMAEAEIQLRDLRGRIADNIRTLHDAEDQSVFVRLLTEGTIAGAVDRLQYMEQINASLKDGVDQLRRTNKMLEEQRLSLREKQEDAAQLQVLNGLAKEQLNSSLSQQADLLKETKGKESEYQAVLKDTQRRAAQIRSRIYQLQGVSNQPTFGEAVTMAKQAGSLTGVRPAFLLAILTQESNLGKNVGTCNRPGDPPEKSWRVVMKPERDQAPFLTVTSELGLDPEVTPVSCPMRGKDGKQIGWGGAMGPAQFIPSTWMGYKDKVAALTGRPANPWNIQDAFIAAGVKLAAGGATTQAGEWAAAMRYFSGSTNPQFRFYGDNVVNQAEKYQAEIEIL